MLVIDQLSINRQIYKGQFQVIDEGSIWQNKQNNGGKVLEKN